jgi:lipid A disaccharide synthetase
MKFYFIAGENSGDFIGAQIIKSIKKINSDRGKNISFYGIGGPQMKLAGINNRILTLNR